MVCIAQKTNPLLWIEYLQQHVIIGFKWLDQDYIFQEGIQIMKCKYVLLILFFFLFGGIVHGEPVIVGTRLPPFILEDQHGESHKADKSLQLIVFGKSRTSNKIMEAALENVNAGYLSNHHTVYIANISGMPGIVTKSLALPKMRKLPYVILVDKDDSVSKGFPSTSNAITILQVKDLRIVSVDFSNDPEAIKKVIDAIVP